MENEATRLVRKVQELSDLELAVLLCLITGEHCMIEAEQEDIEAAEQALIFLCSNTFGLASTVIHCSENTSLDEFSKAILIEDQDAALTPIISHGGNEKTFFSSVGDSRRLLPQSPDFEHSERIADVVIARNLHLASNQVQIQTLELIRSKRIFTRIAVHTAPKRFLVVALTTAHDGPRLVPHLNDQMFISHFYEDQDHGTKDEDLRDDGSSTGSVVRSPPATPGTPGFFRRASYMSYMEHSVQKNDIDTWISLASAVKLSSDVRAYMHNIVVFMRMHRAVAKGVTGQATRHLYALAKALAPLHGLDFITPSLVALAVRKIYPHRLTITLPENEMSLQWGSSLDAVAEYLENITVEDIIDDVLGTVETPL